MLSAEGATPDFQAAHANCFGTRQKNEYDLFFYYIPNHQDMHLYCPIEYLAERLFQAMAIEVESSAPDQEVSGKGTVVENSYGSYVRRSSTSGFTYCDFHFEDSARNRTHSYSCEYNLPWYDAFKRPYGYLSQITEAGQTLR
jgi:hypothetical protein